ncbi:hypothetical protein DPMN_095194 [Dreissena polymorpha]|uniref:Uncharacterized protein n=1 Tax=Dreissena polymorpha TaxID=45954 RepID=A0A9D4L6X4_DREPO|nr:hypothetical protein DPMN_095194 [Dreissena polymorpha]
MCSQRKWPLQEHSSRLNDFPDHHMLVHSSFQTSLKRKYQILIVGLFGGKSDESLELLLHNVFTKKVATAGTFVTPERLPRSSHASSFLLPNKSQEKISNFDSRPVWWQVR